MKRSDLTITNLKAIWSFNSDNSASIALEAIKYKNRATKVELSADGKTEKLLIARQDGTFWIAATRAVGKDAPDIPEQYIYAVGDLVGYEGRRWVIRKIGTRGYNLISIDNRKEPFRDEWFKDASAFTHIIL